VWVERNTLLERIKHLTWEKGLLKEAPKEAPKGVPKRASGFSKKAPWLPKGLLGKI